MNRESAEQLRKTLIEAIEKDKNHTFRRYVLTTKNNMNLLGREYTMKLFVEEFEKFQELELSAPSEVDRLFYAQILNNYADILIGDARDKAKSFRFYNNSYKQLQKVNFEELDDDEKVKLYYEVWKSYVRSQNRDSSVEGFKKSKKANVEIEQHILKNKDKLKKEESFHFLMGSTCLDLGFTLSQIHSGSTKKSDEYYVQSIEHLKKTKGQKTGEIQARYKLYEGHVQKAREVRKIKEARKKNKNKKNAKPPLKAKTPEERQRIDNLTRQVNKIDEKEILFNAYKSLGQCVYELVEENTSILYYKLQYCVALCLYEMKRFQESLDIINPVIEGYTKNIGEKKSDMETFYVLQSKIYDKLGLEFNALSVKSLENAHSVASAFGRFEDCGKIKLKMRKVKMKMKNIGKGKRKKKKKKKGGKDRKAQTSSSASEQIVQKKRLEMKTCSNAYCGKVESRKNEFKRCGRCSSVHYCSRDCQIKSWNSLHRDECKWKQKKVEKVEEEKKEEEEGKNGDAEEAAEEEKVRQEEPQQEQIEEVEGEGEEEEEEENKGEVVSEEVKDGETEQES